MTDFDQGAVIKVPFPDTDRPVRQYRPAVVVSVRSEEPRHGLLWVLMITSAENRGWPGDVVVDDLEVAGLPAPSIVRTAKIATIEAADASLLGHLSRAALNRAMHEVRRQLGLP
jgi:mRNA interferase MazF